ncbi:hypothetical protein QYF36_007801 [Acer negundo]|nr:hypothetical protein QYF36_007801 [Acer negundo]
MPNSFPSNGLNPNFQFYKGEVFANYEPKVTTRSDLCGLVGKGMLELQDMDMISDGGFIDGELRSSYNDSKNVKEWEGEVGLSGEDRSMITCLSSTSVKKRRERKCNFSFKRHGMKTRSSKSSLTLRNSSDCDIGWDQESKLGSVELELLVAVLLCSFLGAF